METKHITQDFIYNTIDEGNPRYDIQPKNIFSFLSSGSDFKKIPIYQRPYSWKEEHLTDFLDDIFNVSIEGNNKNSWFLGSIYITKKSSSDLVSYILDGQQRITSLQIILRELQLSKFYDSSIIFSDDFENIKRSIDTCLTTNDNGKYVPRFHSEEVTNEFLHDYLDSSYTINNSEEYEKFNNEFLTKIDDNLEKSLSVKTLYENIKLTKSYLLSKILKQKTNSKDSTPSKRIENFANALLYKFWIIEIPLKKESISIEIFEGLNNRGKPLSLLDKLQFRSLSKRFDDNETIKKYWAELYTKIDKLNRVDNSKIFSNDIDFTESFFLSKLGKEFNEKDLITDFENSYLKSFEKLKFYFELNFQVLDFFLEINNLHNSKFIDSFNKKEKNKIKSILWFLKLLLKEYKNTIYPLISILQKYDFKNSKLNYTILRAIWGIIQLSFYKNILESQSPNNIRKDFLYLINKFKSDESIYQGLIHKLLKYSTTNPNDDNDLYDLSNLSDDNIDVYYNYRNKELKTFTLLTTKKNSKSMLILALYTLINNHIEIINYSEDQKKELNLEHIFPRAWKTNWAGEIYNSEDVKTYLNQIGYNSISEKINQYIEFELKKYDTTPWAQNESLVEWIGNKLILNQKINKSISNSSFENKFKKGYDKKSYLILPNIKSKNLELFSDTEFDYKKVIDRSIEIINSISNQFFKIDWDEIN